MLVACPNHCFGCEEMLCKKDVFAHKETCRYFPCKYFLESDGCRETAGISQIKDHEDVCPFGKYPCVVLINNIRAKLGLWRTCNDNNLLRWGLCDQGKPFDVPDWRLLDGLHPNADSHSETGEVIFIDD
eukprot:jgi/Mesvir1/20131/Mv13370-RA.1